VVKEDNLAENNFIDSKFRQVILAAKRARQLLAGSKKKIEIDAENPLTIAMAEIKQGKIDFEILLHEEMVGIENGLELEEGDVQPDEGSGVEADSEAKQDVDAPEADTSNSEEVSPPADPE
jgi:DNA-directed RNA polymerase subunit omega